MRVQLHNLQLVYPPISNQEAEWVKNDKEVQNLVRKSNLYFIGQKPESYFTFNENNIHDKIQIEKTLPFKYHTGSRTSSGYLDLIELFKYHDISEKKFDDIEIEIGLKLIRIWFLIDNEVVDWFTTEKLLFDKWRNKPFIKGFSDYKDFSVYQLHYIGISKSDDSLTRLILKPHDKRLRILSNEHPYSNGSRISDELILFFFKIDSFEIKQYFSESDLSEFGKNELEDKIRIISDAEKAFVKVLNTQYNEVKFKKYPISEDGLFNSTIDRYSFSIDEDIEFITIDNVIRGKFNCTFKQDGFDFISIDKKEKSVELIKL